MSFLQPFLLIALAAAAIPILLHILTLRRLKVVSFSTLSFLKELQRSRIRAVRLRQLILLLLRTLLVLLIVLAFARPAFRGGFDVLLGGQATTDAVIFYDDSYSMSLRGEQGTLIRQASASVAAVLESLTDDDHVLVLPFSSAAEGTNLSDRRWMSPGEARAAFGSLQISPVSVSLEDVLRRGASMLKDRTAPNRELYVISDLQRGLATGAPVQENLFDGNIAVTVIPAGASAEENMSLRSVSVATSIIEPGTPVSFDIRLRNDRSAAPRTVSVSLFLDGQRLDQRVQTLENGEERTFTLQGIPQRAGFLTGSITLEGDDADFDNTSWFALNIPTERRVLVVGDPAQTYHVRLALSAEASKGRTGFRITSVPPDRLTPTLLKENDVFVVVDAPLRTDVRRTLAEQVSGGKGLILIPPAVSSPDRGTGTVADVTPGSFRGETVRVPEGSFLTFGRTDLRHPIFEGMFLPRTNGGNRTDRLESPDIFAFAPGGQSGNATVILSMSNGQPFLSESRFGNGRTLIFGVSLVPDWSSLPFTGLFVPLLHRSVVYVSGHTATRPSIGPGQEVTLPLPVDRTADLRLRFPDRQELPVQPLVLPTGPVLRTAAAVLPGVYSLSSGNEEIDRFAVNLSVRESDVIPIPPGEVADRIEAAGVDPADYTYLEQGNDLGGRVYASRVGAELWGPLLILALIVAIAETWLAGTLRSPAEGQAGS